MKAVLNLQNNWKITKASVETLAMIFIEMVGLTESVQAIAETIQNINSGDSSTIATVTKALQTYQGRFASNLSVFECHNIIPRVLRYQLATLLTGTEPASTFKANYIALGNGSGTPQPTDVKLVFETLRGTFSNRYRIDETAYFDKFFSTTEVQGMTFTEAGVFCDGTASSDSGFLLSRIEMNESISANETLTFNAAITITSAT